MTSLSDSLRHGRQPRRGAVKADGVDPKHVTMMPGTLLIERDTPEKQTEGGIFIPDNAARKQITGRIRAMGDLDRDEGDPIQLGVRVMFGKYTGTVITMNGVEYLVAREDDVVMVIGDEVDLEEPEV